MAPFSAPARLLLLLSALLGTISSAHADCPSTRAGWVQWRDKLVRDYTRDRFKKDQYGELASESSLLEGFTDTLQTCRAKFDKIFPAAEADRCFGNMIHFTRVATPPLSPEGNPIDYEIPLATYYGAGPSEISDQAKSIPQILQELSLHSLLNNSNTRNQALKEIEQRVPGSIGIVFNSRSLPAFDPSNDSNYRRTLIYLPGQRIDTWAQVEANQFSIVAVEKADQAGVAYQKPKIFIKDWWRVLDKKRKCR